MNENICFLYNMSYYISECAITKSAGFVSLKSHIIEYEINLQLGITTAGLYNFLSFYDCDLGFCIKLSINLSFRKNSNENSIDIF